MAMTREQFETWMENQRQHQQAMIETLTGPKKKTLVDCTARFGGQKESVESFLSAVRLFKELEKLADHDVLKGLPLLLTDEASDWWQGIHESVLTYADFQDKLRQKYSPKQPAYLLYNEICGTKQKPSETTENFVAKKRLLFSKLPAPKHPEIQQLDMVYMLLRLDIRDKIPRNNITTFDNLIESARGVEKVLEERIESIPSTLAASRQSVEPTPARRNSKVKCGFCKLGGHTSEVCRKRIKAEKSENFNKEAPSKTEQVPPSPAPKVSCYGCGAPGVVRTNCSNCAGKSSHNMKAENISFCALNVKACVQSRPVLFIEIGGENGCAYVDTCAKANIASYSLYLKLVEKGYTLKEERVNLSLADGVAKVQTVLVVQVTARLSGRAIPTTFLVLPESRNNKTLLGIGFLKAAGMILDLSQFTWQFYDNPTVHELFSEEFVKFERKAQINSENAATPISIASIGRSIPDENTSAEPECAASYPKLRRLDQGSPKSNMGFDGYSPRFDYMLRDAQMNANVQEDLPPRLQHLFPDIHYPNVGIDSLDVSLPPNDMLDSNQQFQLETILKKHEEVFIDNGQPAKDVVHGIETGTKGPIAVPPYRLSPPRRDILEKEIQKMLKGNIIEARPTPWAAPAVLVPKPNGQVRVCVDYRQLNAITVADTYPIPRIDDLLHEAKPTPCMSSLDLKAGYWQIRISEHDRDKTGFITPFGIYVFNRMPFGLRNAPATFQRMIDRIRVSLGNVKLLAYLDDLIVFSTSFAAHMTDLEQVFLKLREYNLTVNLVKCRFCCSTIKYLGHYITPEGLKMDPEKISAIMDLPPPPTLRHLVSFLQSCSWYRRFIEGFSKVAEPLSKLTKKGALWTWTEQQQVAYEELKRRLTAAPILRQADQSKPYIIKTDASGYALGAVLIQGEGAEEHPVEYASRLLTQAERNYSTTEREALAVVWAANKFRGYIEGLPTVIVTDHQALKWLMSLKSPTGRLARWALQLQALNITIKYSPGRTNVVADMLSRPPCTDDSRENCGFCSVTITMPTRSTKEIREEQLKDSFITNIVETLEKSESTANAAYWNNKGYYLNNGLLYRLSPDSDLEDAQLVVPEHEWANVLLAYHDDPLAGHNGAEKTYARISRRYFWRGMRRYIESYIKNCPTCQRYKPSNLKPAGLLQTSAMNKRFEVISFDLFGPQPVSPDGKSWILIVEDCASRWVELFALANATAEKCAETLVNEIFLRFGIPRKMTSDNGTQFVSAIMQQVCFCFNIKHSFTPVYHPEANPVERRNRDLKVQLAILVGDEHRNWPEKLPSIRFAMNTAVCSSTTYSPAYLTFGRDLRTPDDIAHDFREVVVSENFIPEITPKLLQISDTMEKAREVHEMKEEKRKEYVDRHRRESPIYKPGDLVLADVHALSSASKGHSSKFSPRRDGPYLIVGENGPSSYRLANANKPGTVIGTYHVSAIRPFHSDQIEIPSPTQPLRRRGRPRKAQPPPMTEKPGKQGGGGNKKKKKENN